MKKNKMMRVASFLLVAVLLSTSVISGTFAKYTTQDSAGDVARVAKWGVELQVAGILYGGNYNGTDHTPLAWSAANAETVSASETGTNVVAPGTLNNDGLSFSLNGVPEVSGTVTTVLEYENIYLKAGKYGVMVKLGKTTETEYNAIMAATADTDKLYVKSGDAYSLATAYDEDTEYYTLEDYVDLTADYYPVIYTLTGGESSYTAGAITADSLANAVAVFAANLGTGTPVLADGKTTVTYEKAFTPNTDLKTSLKIDNEKLTWAWAFENGSVTTSGNAASMESKADTILGNLQAGTTTPLNGEVVKLDGSSYKAPVAATGTDANDYNLETCFSIDITVTQVD